MKCDNLTVIDVDTMGDIRVLSGQYYSKPEADEAIAELKEKYDKEREIANEQTFELWVEKENVCQLELLWQKQKEKADKLFSFLNDLVMRDLIKDCPTKEVAAKIVKEFK